MRKVVSGYSSDVGFTFISDVNEALNVNVNNRICDTFIIVLDVNCTTKLYQQEGILGECQPPACLQYGLQSEQLLIFVKGRGCM